MLNLSESWLGATLAAMAAAPLGGEAPADTARSGSLMDMLPLFAALAVFFYLMVLRPQKKDREKAANMLDSLQKGDRVVTIGGLHGKIAGLDENRNVISLEVAPKVSIKVNRDAVRSVEKKSGGPDKADEGRPKEDLQKK